MRRRYRMVKTRLPEKLYAELVDYARASGVSEYEAVRRLISSGLRREGGIYRLVSDDDFLISLITVRVKADPEFAARLLEILRREAEEL